MKTTFSTPLSAIICLFAGNVLLAETFVKNPSFEANYNDSFPHYGAIDEWRGGSGVNEAGGPFHNGGTPIPDGVRVGFSQGSATLSQDISGLTPGKQYWIQYQFDSRKCCGGTIDIVTKWNDTQLAKVANVKPADGGRPFHSPLTPTREHSHSKPWRVGTRLPCSMASRLSNVTRGRRLSRIRVLRLAE